jgi:hypothetical protein
MTKDLTYVPVQCINCFDKIAYVSNNHEDTESLDLNNFPILCLKCEAKINGA